MAGFGKLPSVTHYFSGGDASQWRTDVPNYAKVVHESVYPGVDMVFYGNQRQLEFDFIVAPGSDPAQIQLEIDGAMRMRLDRTGNLVIETEGGETMLH
ncbi:MAG TPA: hypothetical protein VMN36_04395 [Verrucomicrobiales bacterium]|nr:hypothetical protein [Verrucomicrobiales bacterium]